MDTIVNYSIMIAWLLEVQTLDKNSINAITTDLPYESGSKIHRDAPLDLDKM